MGDLASELLRLLEQRLGLEQVDDVDAAALAVDEAAHLGVPAARLVAEVHSGLQQLPDADVGHGECSLECGCGLRRAVRGSAGPGVGAGQGRPRAPGGSPGSKRYGNALLSVRKFLRGAPRLSLCGPALPSPTSGGPVRAFPGWGG